ncbi:MAG TPA: redox-sensitive transcriptional activator SoxR [Hyphomonadaceae bacterium]|jgi:MerR family redox-sensitive transcriptional activator SoxR|nr:redox-sensitive transcriptional activator SoxR [Hyphomonadaceae bacterium]
MRKESKKIVEAEKPAVPVMLTVGDLARRAGVAVSTLHFYEAEGLIRSMRTQANHRRYPRGMLRRVAIIKVAQKAGIPLREIAEALDALPDGKPTVADWRAMASRWRESLDDRIGRLTRLRDQMSDCIGCGCLSITACPLRNPGDRLAAEGAGPRILDPVEED